jgi:hypothetical protein
MRTETILLAIACALMVSGCGNSLSQATSIGNDTYIMTAKAKPSPFGVAHAVDMGALIEEASASCTDRGLRFVLVDRQENDGNTFKLGTGSVTYKCEK